MALSLVINIHFLVLRMRVLNFCSFSYLVILIN